MKGPLSLEKASMSILLSLLPIWFVLHLCPFLVFFIFPCLIFFIFQASQRSAFQIEAEIDLSLELSFLDQPTLTLQSSVRPPSDSDVAATHSIVRHLNGLDLLFLSARQKDAFYAALAMLALPSKVP